MADAGSGLQHQAGDPTYGNDRAHPTPIHHHEGAIDHVELAFLQEQDGRPFLERNGSRRRQSGCCVRHIGSSPADQHETATEGARASEAFLQLRQEHAGIGNLQHAGEFDRGHA